MAGTRASDPVTARRVIDAVARIGDDRGQDEETRLRLRFMIASAVAMGLGGLVWGALALLLGLVADSAVPFGYSAITALNLMALRRTKNFPRARAIQVLISLLLPYMLQWLLGGFVASGCTMLWALLALTAAMSFGGLRESLMWLGFFLALLAISVGIDPFLNVPAVMTNPAITLAAFAMNVGAVSCAVFGLMSVFLNLRHRSSQELAERNRQLAESQQALVQSEKMAALGRLSAGMAHELNNPAAAAQRSARQLVDAVARLRNVCFELGRAGLNDAQSSRLRALDDRAEAVVSEPPSFSAIERMDQASRVQSWLDDACPALGIDASVLVDFGFDPASLGELLTTFGEGMLPSALDRVVGWHTIIALLGEIGNGTDRIVTIVKALKSYSYLDQAPVQDIDVHDGLDDTLVILTGLLKGGVAVHREYDRSLPRVSAHGSELNQVWTNLIENAAQAMDGRGELTIRTARDGDSLLVQIIDTGPGIPEDILQCVFDPFMTTKPVGQGTGLGLHISQKIVVEEHRGTIRVDSEPGRTNFEVRLPITG
jgi:signal transduction histidine kinase